MIDLIFILILIVSVIAHELAHGYSAESLGDPTARFAGRLTLNPFAHLDLVGSFIVPFLLYFLPGGIIFGWAKPVPYNPYNLRNQKWGEIWIAFAGPLTNMCIAVFFGLMIRFSGLLNLSSSVIEVIVMIVIINIVLALFNLVPIPPLDGSKILFNLLPCVYNYIGEFLARQGFVFLIVFIFLLWGWVAPIIAFIFSLITGIQL